MVMPNEIRAQGNMLIQIDSPNPNPTQMLITALQARGLKLTKEEEFYLSIEKERGERRVVRILSGDPSRGALALETEVPLAMGQTVQVGSHTSHTDASFCNALLPAYCRVRLPGDSPSRLLSAPIKRVSIWTRAQALWRVSWVTARTDSLREARCAKYLGLPGLGIYEFYCSPWVRRYVRSLCMLSPPGAR